MTLPQNPQTIQAVGEVALTVSPEVKIAAVKALLSEGDVEVTEVLRGRRDETLELVRRLLASAGIEGTKNEVNEQALLSLAGVTNEKTAAKLSPVVAAPETTPEAVETGYLGTLKARFDAHPELHPGVLWMDVKKALEADPAKMATLEALDEKGHEMNVFRSKNNGAIQFRSAQTNVTKISGEHCRIMYDRYAQDNYPHFPHNHINGNAVDIVASMGCDLADGDLYEQLRVYGGAVWLKTDAATRAAGSALIGTWRGLDSNNDPNCHMDDWSLCPALSVAKVA